MTEENQIPDKLDAPEDGSDVSTPPEGDKVQEQLAQLMEKYSTLEESTKKLQEGNEYLRSEKDRAIRELHEFQKTQLQQLSQAEQRKSQEQFLKEWREKINENPDAAIDFYQGALSEVEAANAERVASIEKKFEEQLQQSISAIQDTLSKTDTRYLSNKETVDRLVAGGMQRDKAIEFAEEINASKVTSPSSPPAPGTVDASTVVREEGTPPVKLDAHMSGLANLAGLTAEEQKQLEKNIAEAMKT